MRNFVIFSRKETKNMKLKRLEKFPLELSFWIISLVYLAIINPTQSHFSFCVLNQLGISWCPGCGIGNSISYLLHGDIIKSFQSHILGTFALVVIVYRIIQLIIKIKQNKNQTYGESVLKS